MPAKAIETSYQALADQLDDVVSKLQSPDVSVDDAVKYYQRAMELIDKMERYLQEAENRVRDIKARFAGSE